MRSGSDEVAPKAGETVVIENDPSAFVGTCDARSSRTDGFVVPAATIQAASLAAVADLFAVVKPRESDILG